MCSPLVGGGAVKNLYRYAKLFRDFMEQL